MNPPENALPIVSRPERTFGAATGACVVVGSMIGVGVFTTTGYLVHDLKYPEVVLAGWLVGGVAAMCGAFCYAELGAAIPENGGEYKLLSQIYHPFVGFLAGWVSFVVGFSAPTAMMGLVFGSYLNTLVPAIPPVVAAVALIVGLSILHTLHVGWGGRVHTLLTWIKLALLAVFIVGGLAALRAPRWESGAPGEIVATLFSGPFAISLYFISFTYAGWNSAAYIAGEIRDPARNLPRAILVGTGAVCVVYLLLNLVFLLSTPAADLAASGDKVALVAAKSLFGESGGAFVAVVVAAGLVSTVSAQLLAGPRVSEAIGRDYPALRFLTLRRAEGGPVVAILLQAALAIVLAVSSSFNTLLTYAGLLLSVCAALAVAGVWVLRRREPGLARPFLTPLYPWPIVFVVVLEVWMLWKTATDQPLTLAAAGGTIVIGGVLWFVAGRATPSVVSDGSSR
jgi:basic amino acid/polyamine antiporter, APA family